MPVIVLAPDKFKGSLTAQEVCAAMARGLLRVWPDAEVRAKPMADGGDGTLDALLASGGERGLEVVAGAEGRARPRPYGVLRDARGEIGVLEAASIVGITDPEGMKAPVLARTTRGIGESMRALMDRGIRRFMIGLGGSSTNDGGAGLLAALGLKLLDVKAVPVEPGPHGLARLDRVDASTMDARIARCEITVLSDVDNPLTGPRGATAVFGPQKGVAAADVAGVDATLARFGQCAEQALGRSVANAAGAGAAGGLGFALLLLGATLRPGAEVVADLIDLDGALAGADWLITGEGRSDAQTLAGKAPWIAALRARRAGVPATLVAGALDVQALPELSAGFAGCFALPDAPMTLATALARADGLLADRTEQVARLWHAARAP